MKKLIIALLLAATSLLNAGSVCGGPSATGNGSGSDWNNQAAWSSVSFSRGNTYWLADGSYTSRDFPDRNESLTPITTCTLKKAIESSHGPSAGWVSALGDGQAVMNGPWLMSSDVIVNGQTGGGPGSWKTGFGIKLDASVGHGAGIAFYGHRIQVKHIEIIGNYGDGNQTFPSNDLVIMGGLEGNSLSYAYVHGAGRCLLFGNSTKNFTVEYCYFGWMEDQGGSEHGELMSMQSDSFNVGNGPIIFRYCIFTSSGSTGGLMMKGPMEVYGCVFAPLDGNILKGGHGVLGTWTQHDVQLKVYNCTFINLSTVVCSVLNSAGDTGEFKNNLILNSAIGDADRAPMVHQYNHYINVGDTPAVETGKTTGSGDPFVNWQAGNFEVRSNTASGVNLGPPYNVDMDGQIRTTWTRGALEFGAAAPGPTPSPTPPPPTPTPTPTPSATPSPTPTPPPSPTPSPVPVAVYRINSGGGAQAPFSGDTYVSGGTVNYDPSSPIDVSGVVNPAPVRVYQAERYGNFSYTLPSLTPGATYLVRLHFAELFWGAGKRRFNVILNGEQVLTSFDIAAAAGGARKAIVREFTTKATAAGQILIGFVTVSDNAKASGIEVYTSNPTPTPTPPPSPAPRKLTVSSVREYAPGTIVPISAPTDPPGFAFDRWTGDVQSLNNFLNRDTTATVPSSMDIGVGATYQPK